MGNGSLDDQTHESRAKTADSINGTPLLGSLLSVWKKEKSSLYESQLSTAYSHLTYVSDFRVNDDRILLPQGTLLELLTEYSREKWRKTTLTCHLEAVEFHALLKIAADEPFVLQTLVKPAQSDADSLRVSSQGNDYTLTSLLTAVVRNVRDFECKPYVNFARLKATLNKAIITKDDFYQSLESKRGTRYGRLMRAIDVVNVGECECLCLVDLGERTEGRIARLFEAVIQAIFYIEPNLQAINRIAEINAIYLKHRKVFVHAKFDRRTNEGAVSIYAEDGDTVCELRGVTGRMAEVEKAEEQDTVLPSKLLYTLSWTPKSTDQTDSAQSTGPWVYIGAESVGRTLKRLARQHYSSLEMLTISSGCLKSIISDLVSLIAETANLRGLLFDMTTSNLAEDDLTLIEDTLDSINRILINRRPQAVRALWLIMPFNLQTAPLSGWLQEMAQRTPFVRWKHLSVDTVAQLLAEIGSFQTSRADDFVVKYTANVRCIRQLCSIKSIVQKSDRITRCSHINRFKLVRGDKESDRVEIRPDIQANTDVVGLENEISVTAFTLSKRDWQMVCGETTDGDCVIGAVDQISSSHLALPKYRFCLISHEIDPIKSLISIADYYILQATIFALTELKPSQCIRVFLSNEQLGLLSHFASAKHLHLKMSTISSQHFSETPKNVIPVYLRLANNHVEITTISDVNNMDEIFELELDMPDESEIQFMLLALSEGLHLSRNDISVLPLEEMNKATESHDSIVIKVPKHRDYESNLLIVPKFFDSDLNQGEQSARSSLMKEIGSKPAADNILIDCTGIRAVPHGVIAAHTLSRLRSTLPVAQLSCISLMKNWAFIPLTFSTALIVENRSAGGDGHAIFSSDLLSLTEDTINELMRDIERYNFAVNVILVKDNARERLETPPPHVVTVEKKEHFDWTSQAIAELESDTRRLEAVSAKIESFLREVGGLHAESVISHEKTLLALGIDSLRIIAFQNRLQEFFEDTISLSNTVGFQYPTIRLLAQHICDLIELSKVTRNVSQTFPIIERTKPLPLSKAQQRLAFLHDFQGGRDSHYNETVVLNVDKVTNFSCWRMLINSVVMRQASLRTVFKQSTAVVMSGTEAYFHISMSAVSECSAQSEQRKDCRRQFELAKRPPARFRLTLTNSEINFISVQHHIITDGWSVAVFMDEMSLFYDAFILKEHSNLSPLSVQYVDYATWESTVVDGRFENHIDYWKTALAGLEDQEMSTDKSRPAEQTFDGRTAYFSCDDKLIHKLRLIAQEQSSTLYMALLAVFQLLLSQNSGLTDILVGIPVANRQHAQLEKLLGFFVNTLVIRTKIPNASFTSYLCIVKEALLNAQLHQDVPFEKLLESLDLDRNMAVSPLFQIMFVMDDAKSLERAASRSLRATPLELSSDYAKFDQTWYVTEDGTGLRGRVEYNTNLYHHRTIEKSMQRFALLMERVFEHFDDKSVQLLPFISPLDHRRVFQVNDRNRCDFPRYHSLVDGLRSQTKRCPSKTAIAFEEFSYSYDFIDQLSNQIARALLQKNIAEFGEVLQRERTVALYINRDIHMIAAIFAVVKSGAAFVPLSVDFPLERRQGILEELGNPLLLTGLQMSLTSGAQSLIVDCPSLYKHYLSKPLRELATPDSIAYLTYTSGTTGKPKGVCTRAQGVMNLIPHYCRLFVLQEASVTYQVVNYAFDICCADIFQSFFNASLLALAKEKVPNLVEMEKYKATHAYIMPAFLAYLSPNELSQLASLHLMSFGGETIQKNALSFGINSGYRMVQQSGVTEQSIFSIGKMMRKMDAGNCVGYPYPNTTLYVLDEVSCNVVQAGRKGKYYAGGFGLTRGYFDRPVLNKEKLVPNPLNRNHVDQDNAMLFDSGDIYSQGDYTAPFMFNGRRDFQVKIRGLRVELGEIESVIASLDRVKNCVVIALNHSKTGPYLVAYFTPTAISGIPLDVAEIKTRISLHLPEYMIPSFMIELEKFPLTSNGKVDRQALPSPAASTVKDETAFMSPRNDMEVFIHEIWCNVLDGRQFSVNACFFQSGGNSLKATQVVVRLNQLSGIHLSVRVIFEHRTIEQLAKYLLARTDVIKESVVIPATNKLEPIILSYPQQRLWFMYQFESGDSHNYNIPLRLSVRGAMNSRAFHSGLNTIAQRHTTMRTVFRQSHGDEPNQIILSATECYISVQFGVWLDEERQQALNCFYGFNLTARPAIRTRCSKTKESFVLLLVVHHILTDGWSMAILAKELAHFYERYTIRNANVATLPKTGIQYADFSAWQRRYIAEEAMRMELKYWKENLRDVEDLQLPTDRKRPAVQGTGGRTIAFEISQVGLYQSLFDVGKQTNSTLYMVLLSAYALLIHLLSSQKMIAIGTPVANRNQIEIENLIGFFVNTIVMKMQVERVSFSDLVSSVKETALAAYRHQNVPFEFLIDALGIQRDLSRSALFQVMFILQNASAARLPDMAGVVTEVSDVHLDSAKFDWTLAIAEKNGRLAGTLQYSTALFYEETCLRTIMLYQNILSQVAANAALQVSEIELLPVAQQRLLLKRYVTRNEPETPRYTSKSGILTAQCKRTPDNVFAKSRFDELSFGCVETALNVIGNRVKQSIIQLRGESIKADTPIAVCCLESVDTYLSLALVQAIGGAYVPMDHKYPIERLSYIMQDSDAPVMLVNYNIPAEVQNDRFCVINISSSRNSLRDYGGRGRSLKSLSSGVNLAYFIYTSGTTGKPKGVCTNQQSVINLIHFATAEYVIPSSSRLYQFTKCVFDGSVSLIFGAFMNGAQLCIRDDTVETMRDVAHHAPITHFHMTPVVIGSFSRRDIQKLAPVIDQWSVGGDSMELKAMKMVLKAGIRMIQRCGPTEATVFTTTAHMKLHSHFPTKIGPPINNMISYLVNQYDRLVPFGVPGEFLMGGGNVSRGYMKRPELTEKGFVANRFSTTEDRAVSRKLRVFRSGDMITRTPTGEFVYGGRRDTQVKVRGYRIEMLEIQSAVSSYSQVEACTVMIVKTRGEFIVAYCIASAGTERIAIGSLMGYLKKKLPEFMIPHKIVQIDSFPTNANGKIDRSQLPPVDFTESSSANNEMRRPPRNDFERILHDIWCAVLDLKSISVDDNFFQVGGHSLKAAQVVSRVKATMNVQCELRLLFEYPTIEQLADVLSNLTIDKRAGSIALVDKSRPLNLSFMQNRLLFQSTFENSVSTTGSHVAYNVPIALSMSGPLNLRAFNVALNAMGMRQASMRTVFVARPAAAQIILSGTESLICLNAVLSKCSLQQVLKKDAAIRFDVLRKVPVMARLVYCENKTLFSLVMHHIITDGWSVQVIAEELSDLYGRLTDKRPVLATPSLQYVDYAPWHTTVVSSTKDALSAYWKEKLEGYEDLQLHTDLPRPPLLSFWGSTVPFRLNNIGASIQRLCSQLSLTPYMVMLAAFKLLMANHSSANQRDITVGTPIANRQHQSVEKLIGFFVNTLAIRSEVDAKSVQKLLQDVKTSTLEAFQHQDLPFEFLIELLRVQRSVSISPIFQVMFVLQNTAEVSLKSTNQLELQAIDTPVSVTKFDLTLFVSQSGDDLIGSLEYSSSLFHFETAQKMVRHWAVILENVCNNRLSSAGYQHCMTNHSTIAYLTTLEERRDHYSSEVINNDYPRSITAYAAFNRQSRNTPSRIVAELERETLDYRNLETNASQLQLCLNQAFLATTGETLRPDSVIAICADRGFALLAAVLAVLKSGAAYLPLDKTHPLDRIQFTLEETGAKVCLGMNLPVKKNNITCIDYVKNQSVPKRSKRKFGEINKGCDLAYIIYTSGTTGRPKGTTVNQKGVLNMILQGSPVYYLHETDKIYQFTNYVFDNSVLEFFMAILHGGALVMCEGKMNQATILRHLKQHNVTHLMLFPGVVNTFTKNELLELLRLRYWIEGAEKSNPEVMDFCFSNGVNVIQNYGPTETTAYALYRHMRKLDDATNLGVHINNAFAWICGREKRAALGMADNLYILGEGVARGYFHRPDTTAQRFIKNLAIIVEDEIKGRFLRLYDSGDVARRRPDNTVLYVGRSDFQVKIRGFRIELTEIEQVLLLHSDVEQCSVQAWAEKDKPLSLVAYFVLSLDSKATVGDLKQFLAQRLTEYMIPAHFVQLQAIPLTPNTKVDKSKLPPPDTVAEVQDTRKVLPRNAVEWIIHNAWADALEVDSISVREDFFKIGGHSLIAGKVSARVSDALGKDVNIKLLFEHPTIEGMARALQSSDCSPVKPKFTSIEKTRLLRLSFGQEQMWFLHQHGDSSSFLYNLPFVQEFEPYLNIFAVHRSLMQLFQRQTSFRTIFVQSGVDDPHQLVLSGTETYLLPHPSLIRADQLHAQLRINNFIHLNIDKKPAARSTLYRTTNNCLMYELVVHHIISDAWSTRLMALELGELYASIIERRRPILPPLPFHYVDYAFWQREYLKEEKLMDMVAYWKEKLAACAEAPLNLETDKPRPTVSSAHSGCIHFSFAKDIQNALQTYCRATGSTTYMVLLAAFGLVLNRYSTRETIIVGSPTANRGQREVENIFGYFLNNIAMRLDFGVDITVQSYLKNVKCTALEAYSHQDIPFELLVQNLNVSRELNNQPLFQVYFNCRYNLEDAANVGISQAKITEINAAGAISMFDLELDVDEGYQGMTGMLIYKSELFHQNRMAGFVEQLSLALSHLLNDSSQHVPLRGIDCLPEQQKVIVNSFNSTEDFPTYRTLDSIMSGQRRLTPNYLQLRHLSESLTYEQVDEITSKLAVAMRNKFVARTGEMNLPDGNVSICTKRKNNMLLTMLGILKTASSYVPISQEYPAERRQLLVSNSGSPLVFTNGNQDERYRDPDYQGTIIDVDDVGVYAHYAVKFKWDMRSSVDLAFMLYTSGTTGAPKGVALRQFGITSFLQCLTQRTMLHDGGLVFNFSAYVFDNSLAEFFGCFVNGGTSLIPTTNLETVRLLLKESLINYVFMPATFMQTVDEHSGLLLSERLEVLDSGGESLNEKLLENMVKWHINCMLGYGPTETVVVNTFKRLKALDNCMNNGVPLLNSHIMLLDKQRRPVPIGTPGEVVVSGPTARGYFNVEPHVARRFALNTHRAAEDIATKRRPKLYDVGDYAKWLPTGELLFIGRIDTQVKIRGCRVELEGIESTMLSFDGIEGAAIAVLTDAIGRPIGLVGFYVFDQSANEQTLRAALIAYMKRKLPSQMVPSYFVQVDRIPATISGKVDRRALLTYFETIREQEDDNGDERELLSATEKALIDVWAQCLGHSKIKAGDNFFEVGGNSLLTVKLRALLEAKFNVAVRIADLFKYQTVRAMADNLFESCLSENDTGSINDSADIVIEIGEAKKGKTELFFFHPLVGGAVFPYQGLLAKLKNAGSYFGVQHPNTFEEERACQANSLQDLVGLYLSEMRQKSARKLAASVMIGSSLGGILAHEAVAQLERHGMNLPFIICIDSALNAGDLSTWTRQSHDEQMRAIFKCYDSEIAPSMQDAMIENAWQLLQMCETHRPRPIRARMYLFRIEKDNGTGEDYGWGQSTEQPVIIDRITGAHHNMLFGENCAKLAIKITAILREYDSLCVK